MKFFEGKALVDLVQEVGENAPVSDARALCRDPIVESKRAYVMPKRVESLLTLYFKDGKVSIYNLLCAFIFHTLLKYVISFVAQGDIKNTPFCRQQDTTLLLPIQQQLLYQRDNKRHMTICNITKYLFF